MGSLKLKLRAAESMQMRPREGVGDSSVCQVTGGVSAHAPGQECEFSECVARARPIHPAAYPALNNLFPPISRHLSGGNGAKSWVELNSGTRA